MCRTLWHIERPNKNIFFREDLDYTIKWIGYIVISKWLAGLIIELIIIIIILIILVINLIKSK